MYPYQVVYSYLKQEWVAQAKLNLTINMFWDVLIFWKEDNTNDLLLLHSPGNFIEQLVGILGCIFQCDGGLSG